MKQSYTIFPKTTVWDAIAEDAEIIAEKAELLIARALRVNAFDKVEELQAIIDGAKDRIATAKKNCESGPLLNMEKLRKRLNENDCLHIYIRRVDFMHWLAECGKRVERAPIQNLRDEVNSHGGLAVLHFPCNAKQDSFFVSSWWGAIVGESDTENQDASLAIGFPKSIMIISEAVGVCADDAHPNGEWVARFCIGLGLYIGAFPETVVPGLPDDLKHPSHHKGKVASIELTERVCLGGTHASPTAHFRVGHFRLLKSPVYTKKRFQCVWVTETFVNSRNTETVLSPEEAQAA